MSFLIRLASENDLAFIEACARAAYSKYTERIGREPAPMIADFGLAIRNGQVEILVTDDAAIGYVISFVRDDHLFIENVAIHPDHQGKGYASTLFGFLESKTHEAGLNGIELYTNEMMTENLGLYARLGFEETDRRTESGFNRVYFRKDLSKA